ncbi:MAG TPA: metallophosphoesterase [Blastocatellia bacterium]|nr:metallophosphoesterase [Blastocatellia bacterium]
MRIWDAGSGKLLRSLEGHTESVLSVAWSPDGRSLASASSDNTVRIWDAGSGKLLRSLEGHTNSVLSVAWSPDGRSLASASYDNTVRIWDAASGEELKVYKSAHPAYTLLSASFQLPASVARAFGKTALGDDDIIVESSSLDAAALEAAGDFTLQVSAKIVLMGESEVGKSCLALRLAQDRYEEQGTTHGMRLWKMAPEQLSPDMAAPPGEKREVVIWDLGGQPGYRLVQQLFLHDTTLALVLLEPTRGQKAFDDVAEWDLRLEKQLRGRASAKLLVGTKLDNLEGETSLIDKAGLSRLVESGGFRGFFPTSAKAPRGIDELRAAIAKELDWGGLSKTTRPALFQRIREAIDARQQKAEAVWLYSELEAEIREENPGDFDSAAVNTVVEQLALQGVIADTRLGSGQRALVLQIGHIESYAGSLILAAQNNPHGVPAVELSAALAARSLPGINAAERLHPFQERIVMECVVELLLDRGICLKHEGLLLFPALFPAAPAQQSAEAAHTVSLYYDFSGAIDNIYSSLVVRLAVSERFGRIRLWRDRAEYEKPEEGVCGVRKVARRSGLAHLDLLFGEETSSETRDLFTVFVEDHLRKEGVEIREVLGMVCGKCQYSFDEALVRKRIDSNFSDMVCPTCEARLPISQGAKKAREANPALQREMVALKTVIERRTRNEVAEAKRVIADVKPRDEATIRILHLSDLHFNADDDAEVKLQPLVADLRDPEGGLGFERLDYLVVSGDLTNHGDAREFDPVYSFLSGLIERMKLSAERCVIVPGNHDLSWEREVYEWKPKRKVDLGALKPGSCVAQGDGFLVRDEGSYPARFENFGKFYHELIQQPYPLEPESQGVSFLFADDKLQFLAINSAWDIDEYFKDRSGVNESALVRGVGDAGKQIERAQAEQRLASDAGLLKIAVWHHPVTGNEKIIKDSFLAQLQQAKFKLCLHGHVHEDTADLIKYFDKRRRLHVAGAGSLGAPVNDRPESTPRLYNVIEVWRDLSKIRVHTRCLRKDGGAWEGWGVWPDEKNRRGRLTYYDIVLTDYS